MSDRIRPSDLPYKGDRPMGVGFCKDNNGNLIWDGGSFNIVGNNSNFSSPTYNGDGTLASATISGVTYTFTYSAGKIATVTGGGVTKIYTWSGDQLQSVEVS